MRRALALLALLLLGTGPLAAAWPASDAFGYQVDVTASAWVDISGSGSPVTAWTGTADDGSALMALPFNFRFYGVPYSKVSVSTNGYIQFGTQSSYYGVDCLVANVDPHEMAALYWMDLNPGLGGTIYTAVTGTPGSRVAVIQFQGVAANVGGGSVTAEWLLYEGSNNLVAQYQSTASSGSGINAVAGLRSNFDCPNRTALSVSCQQALLSDGLALLYSYPAPEPGCGTPTTSPTFSVSPSFSASPTVSPTFSASPTVSASPTASPTASPSPSVSPTDSASSTASPTASPSATPSPSATATPSASPTPTDSFTPSPTLSPTFSASPSFTNSPTATASATPTASPTASPSATPSATSTSSATPSATASPTASPSITQTFTPTATLFPAAARPACLVLGQPDFQTSALSAPDASSLNSPSGIAWDTRATPYKVYVADTQNHRVLLWLNATAMAQGQPADGVIGQADFSGAQANRGGAVAADTLSGPRGLAVDPNGNLWVADSGNHRVLEFTYPLPLSGAAASAVLGQGNSFGSAVPSLGGVSAQSLNDPTALSFDPFGNLAVADSGDNRVLRFAPPILTNASANAVWGQTSWSGASPNHGGTVDAAALAAPQGVLLDSPELWVADSGNHRVLRFPNYPSVTGSADVVLGQGDFVSNQPNQGYGLTNETRLDAPQGLAMDVAGRILVADTGNNRILAFEPPYANAAALVYGQAGNLGTKGALCNSDGMHAPQALAAAGGSMVVADTGNQRVLFYGCGSVVQVATPTPTATISPTLSATPSQTPSITVTLTPSPSFTAGPSPTQSPSFTASPSLTLSPTLSASATATPSPSPSATPSVTASFSASPSATLSRTAVPTQTPAPLANGRVIAWPNPIDRLAGSVNLAVPPQANAVELNLYDRLGEPVAHLELSPGQAATGYSRWDLRNDQGALVVPGLYYILAKGSGQTWFGRVTVR